MTTKAYDDLVERLRREREGKNEETAFKIVMRVAANSAGDEKILEILFPIKKKRGRPAGSRNKPKVKK